MDADDGACEFSFRPWHREAAGEESQPRQGDGRRAETQPKIGRPQQARERADARTSKGHQQPGKIFVSQSENSRRRPFGHFDHDPVQRSEQTAAVQGEGEEKEGVAVARKQRGEKPVAESSPRRREHRWRHSRLWLGALGPKRLVAVQLRQQSCRLRRLACAAQAAELVRSVAGVEERRDQRRPKTRQAAEARPRPQLRAELVQAEGGVRPQPPGRPAGRHPGQEIHLHVDLGAGGAGAVALGQPAARTARPRAGRG